MTNKELRTLESRVLKRIRRELADVPDGTSIMLSRQELGWSAGHINLRCTDAPRGEEEYTRLVYVHLTRAKIQRIIAKFRKHLASRENRAEQKRIKELMDWANQ